MLALAMVSVEGASNPSSVSAGPVDPALLSLSPGDATPVPADYDGDGSTDMALKGTNGAWYLDFGANGLGGPWDYVAIGYGDGNARPVPARYDADARADLAVKDAFGMWALDYAATGFGLWDWQLFGYGNAASIPVPADYDNDGVADLSVKTDTGFWLINFSADGFASGWEAQFGGYGNALAIPVPGDYDGDHHADLSVKDAGGCWYIDYWNGGFGGWNEIRCGYGNATAVPVPADYDNDGRTDLSVKDSNGNWFVDLAVNGFGVWDLLHTSRGGSTAIAVPGDYDDDGLLDLACYSTVSGQWFIDYASNGFAAWDTWVDNGARTVVDTSRPYITSTTIYGEGGVAVSQMTVGVRYVVDVVVHSGSVSNGCGVEINDALGVPVSLKIVNRNGSTYAADISEGGAIGQTHRRYAITPMAPGNFPLGFQLRTAPPYYPGSEIFNADNGIRVLVVSPPQTAISGKVTQRIKSAAGVFVSGPPIEGATVQLVSSGGLSTMTDSQGRWHFPVAGGSVPMHVKISRSGYSDVHVVNLFVPTSGLFVPASMEQEFTELPTGIEYASYLDYSRGRSLLHVVEISPYVGGVEVARTPSVLGECHVSCDSSQCPTFEQLVHVASSSGALVVMNGTWWNICNGNPVGYVYGTGGFLNSEVWCDNRGGSTSGCMDSNVYYIEGGGAEGLYPAGTTPMFTVSPFNRFDIVESRADFLEFPSNQWTQIGNPAVPIWDVAPRDGVSDVAYAIQIPNPPLLRDGNVIAGGNFVCDSYGNYDYAFARTSVGVKADGTLLLVVADGEGVHGGNGTTGNQMGHFYRDVLGATRAMGFDSGLSTELLLRVPTGHHRVNTITGEDASIQVNPYTEVIGTADGSVGSVGYFLAVSPFDATATPEALAEGDVALRVGSSVGSSPFSFELTLARRAAARLDIHDVSGRRVATLFEGALDSGKHVFEWKGRDDSGAAAAAGVYFYRVTAGDRRSVGKVVLVR